MFNPFTRLGALAAASLLTAVVTGVALLPFYSVNVHGAHASVVSMGFLHSLHRYASDAAMLFSLLHLGRIFLIRAFRGPRAWSWVTGLAALGLLEFSGWLGCWLVWDQAGFLAAEFIARLVDSVPIFGTSLERGLLLDAPVNNQIFFVVFFGHMLLPLGLLLTLWLHVSRVNRPRFLLERRPTAVLVGLLVALAILAPATIGPRAAPLLFVPGVAADPFFLLPLRFYASLPAWVVWCSGLGVSLLLAGVPWLFPATRDERPSVVLQERCIGCGNCFTDCPYQAIEMRPRADTKPFAQVAWVNPDRCLACGICNGTCDSDANRLPALSTVDINTRIDEWATTAGTEWVLFSCVSILGRSTPDEEGRLPGLPHVRVVALGCSGQVNPRSVRRALRHGFAGIFIATSLPGACAFREGDEWIRQRIAGTREPDGGLTEAERRKVRFGAFGAGEASRVIAQVRQVRAGGEA